MATIAQPPPTMNDHLRLGRGGYVVRLDQLQAGEAETIRRDLTVQTTVLPAYKEFVQPKTYVIYQQDAQHLYLPRWYGLERFGPPRYLAAVAPTSISVQCPIEPLAHQARAIQRLRETFLEAPAYGAGGVLSLPCGYGKTFCALKLVSLLNVRTLVVVPTECLMTQWAEAAERFLPGVRIGFIQQKRMEIEGRDLCIAMLHSLSLREYAANAFDTFGLSVFDECHHLSSETFCQTMLKVRTKYTLGLSATPKRRDGLSKIFHAFLGPLLHQERRAGTNKVYARKILLYPTSSTSTSTNEEDSIDPAYQPIRNANGTLNTVSMTTALGKSHARNNLLLQILLLLVEQGRKILIISSRRDQLTWFHEQLTSRQPQHADGRPVTFGFYYGKKGMTPTAHKALLAASAKCDVVLGIDAIAKEGLDIADLNCLFWTCPPGTDIEQPVGRILRKFHDTCNPLVVDIVDQAGNYPKHSKERDAWYRDENYAIAEWTVHLQSSYTSEELAQLRQFLDLRQPLPKVARQPPGRRAVPTAGAGRWHNPVLGQCLI
jgi:superfamily II DNA or RNA helicase